MKYCTLFKLSSIVLLILGTSDEADVDADIVGLSETFIDGIDDVDAEDICVDD